MSSSKQISQQRIKDLADQLECRILNREIDCSGFLRQNELEKLLDTNRFSVRQVLAELAQRGVLEHVPYRGHQLRAHTVEERQQITESRLLLEQGACQLVLLHIDAAGIEQLQQLAQQFDESVRNGDTGQLISSNYAFHQTFYQYCHNPFLSDLINNLREQAVRVSQPGWFNQQASLQASEEHFAIVEALRQKQPEQLRLLIFQHLTGWRRYVQPADSGDQTQ